LEDELLMALPVVPMHEHCPGQMAQLPGEGQGDSVEVERPNPFAVLARLKK